MENVAIDPPKCWKKLSLTCSSNRGGHEDIPLPYFSSTERAVLNCPFEDVWEETSCNREKIGVPTSNKISRNQVGVRRSNSIYVKEIEYDQACSNTRGVWVYQ